MKAAFAEPIDLMDEYWAGYFRADGCISNNYSSYFSQKDEFVVRELARHISYTNKIYITTSNTTYGKQTIARLSSTKITRELVRLGVKSELDPRLYGSKHFWRGMIDGDGSVMVNGRGVAVMALCGLKIDIEQFSSYVASTVGGKMLTVAPMKSIWFARLGGSRARHLGRHLYSGEYSANTKKASTAASYGEH